VELVPKLPPLALAKQTSNLVVPSEVVSKAWLRHSCFRASNDAHVIVVIKGTDVISTVATSRRASIEKQVRRDLDSLCG
jgi:hypothetical protein